MATFATSQEWLNQCTLLIEARPKTTKVTTRYSVKPKPARRVKKSESAATADGQALPDAPAAKTAAGAPGSQNPRAKLVLKAVDPISGVCLRYETTKAAEVSRLIQLLGQLSRRQAGLAAAATAAQDAEDVAMADAPASSPTAAAAPTAPAAAAASPAQTPAAPQQQAGGSKGKKKKGKR